MKSVDKVDGEVIGCGGGCDTTSAKTAQITHSPLF